MGPGTCAYATGCCRIRSLFVWGDKISGAVAQDATKEAAAGAPNPSAPGYNGPMLRRTPSPSDCSCTTNARRTFQTGMRLLVDIPAPCQVVPIPSTRTNGPIKG